MNTLTSFPYSKYLATVAAAVALAWSTSAQAHCDAIDGPVVSRAQQALETGNVNLVLGWVQKKDEPEIRAAFERAAAVRKHGGAAKDLADYSFFETLVRVHRAGEGAAYTGLKPAGHIEPAVAAADRSIATGQLKPVARMIQERLEHGLHQQFEAVTATRNHKPDDVDAARAHVNAYVQYVHYVEALHGAAVPAGEHQDKAVAGSAQPAAHQH